MGIEAGATAGVILQVFSRQAAQGTAALAGLMAGLGTIYFAGLIVASGIALYHYQLIKDRSRDKCFAAFLHNSWFGAAVFAGVVANHL